MRSAPTRVLVILLAGGLAALAPGCTALVLSDTADPAFPCEEPADCAAGSACEAGVCTVVDDANGPPRSGTPVGPEGGTVDGPDGVQLTLPANATAALLHVIITRASSTHIARGVTVASGFFRIAPAAALDAPATLVLPLDAACAGCRLFAETDEGPWTELTAASAPADYAGGLLDALGGLVVAGTVETP